MIDWGVDQSQYDIYAPDCLTRVCQCLLQLSRWFRPHHWRGYARSTSALTQTQHEGSTRDRQMSDAWTATHVRFQNITLSCRRLNMPYDRSVDSSKKLAQWNISSFVDRGKNKGPRRSLSRW